MDFYRIDNRDYKIGDKVEPQCEYQKKIEEKKLQVEQIIEANRPENKPKRNTILMLFQNYQDAKRHWSRQSNSKFYKVQIIGNILHKGDYNKTDMILKQLDKAETVTIIAKEYWAGIINESSIIEIFVTGAAVTEIVSDSEEERKKALLERWKLF